VINPIGASGSWRDPGQSPDFQRHQPLSGEANGFGGCRLRFQPARIQAGQDLSASDPVALLNHHLSDALAVLKASSTWRKSTLP
jgi:hypothetical protein